MRKLTLQEKEEFIKTFNYLVDRIGSFAYLYGGCSIYDLKVNGFPLHKELIDFAKYFDNVYEFEGLKFKNQNSLQKINLIFNNVSKQHKTVALNLLIAYCFRNKVQPNKLRIETLHNGKRIYVTPDLIKRDEPTVAVFEEYVHETTFNDEDDEILFSLRK